MAAVGGKRTMKTKTELPEEVIHGEILTRLPIKSVVRFKSVSKSWLSLFSDPKFVKGHITRSATQNPDDYDFLVAGSGYQIVIFSRYEETILFPHWTYDSGSISYNLIGVVNGLLCLQCDNRCVFWNPAVHQFKKITIPSRIAHIIRIGLGFDPVSNNYKVVVIYISGPDYCLWFASVYSSNSDSWIDITEYEFREWDFGLSKTITDLNVFMSDSWNYGGSISATTIIKNCPYWTYNIYPHNLGGVKFDVGSNKFKLLPRFYAAEGKFSGNDFCRQFMNMSDRLTLMVYERYYKRMVDLYSLDEEGCGVWSKMYSVSAGIRRLQHDGVYLSEGFKYSGEIVLTGGLKNMTYCYDKKIHSRVFSPQVTDT